MAISVKYTLSSIGGPTSIEGRNRYFWWVSAISVLVLAGFVAWQLIDPVSMHQWSLEDGPVENATALLYGIGGCVFVLAAYRADTMMPQGPRSIRLFLLIWAFGSFLIAGEEISWGQRIFDVDTPLAVADVNRQRETNIHNLEIIAAFTDRSPVSPHTAFMGAVGVLFPLIALGGWGRALFQKWWFPVMPAAYMTLVIGAGYYGKLLRVETPYPKDPTEIRELLWAVVIFAFAIHAYVRPWDVFRLPAPAVRTPPS